MTALGVWKPTPELKMNFSGFDAEGNITSDQP